MTRVFLADSLESERLAIRLLLMDQKMEVVGEAADWSTTLAQAPIRQTDMLVVEWNLLPNPANVALEKAREVCSDALVIVLISHHNDRQQAALSSGADAFINKAETRDSLVKSLQAAAASLLPDR